MYDKISMLGVYWQSWSSRWSATAATLDLVTDLDTNCNLVYLCFANPNCSYSKGSKSWSGTGLDFSMDFQIVVDAIKILKTRGITVMLSVGGATYQFNMFPVKPVIDLAQDLGVDGIDLDWEPTLGAQLDQQFSDLIRDYKASLWEGGKLSAAVFSTGAYGKNGDTYQGMNIRGLVSHGSDLNWINLMAYDAGPPPPAGSFDPLGAFTAYRMYYPGPIVFGFEPGPQGWGGHLITLEEVQKNAAFVYKENSKNGIFLWSAQKTTTGSPSVQTILSTAANIWKPKGPPQDGVVVTPNPTLPVATIPSWDAGTNKPMVFTVSLVCGNCKAVNTLTLK